MAAIPVAVSRVLPVTEDSGEYGADGTDAGMCEGPAAGGLRGLVVAVPVVAGEVPESDLGYFGDG